MRNMKTTALTNAITHQKPDDTILLNNNHVVQVCKTTETLIVIVHIYNYTKWKQPNKNKHSLVVKKQITDNTTTNYMRFTNNPKYL